MHVLTYAPNEINTEKVCVLIEDLDLRFFLDKDPSSFPISYQGKGPFS